MSLPDDFLGYLIHDVGICRYVRYLVWRFFPIVNSELSIASTVRNFLSGNIRCLHYWCSFRCLPTIHYLSSCFWFVCSCKCRLVQSFSFHCSKRMNDDCCYYPSYEFLDCSWSLNEYRNGFRCSNCGCGHTVRCYSVHYRNLFDWSCWCFYC